MFNPQKTVTDPQASAARNHSFMTYHFLPAQVVTSRLLCGNILETVIRLTLIRRVGGFQSVSDRAQMPNMPALKGESNRFPVLFPNGQPSVLPQE